MKREIRNTVISNFILQTIIAVYGFVIPRRILLIYGSNQNGVISSIEQMLSYVILLEMGIGNAAVAKLFLPLEQEDNSSVSGIVSYAGRVYRINGYIYFLLCLIIGAAYSLRISSQITVQTTFIIFIILASKPLVDFFFMSKYKILLMADRRLYIYNYYTSFQTVLLIIISVFMIYRRWNLALVKIVVPVLYLMEAGFVFIYIKKKYPDVSFDRTEKMELSQKTDSFIHQICSFVTYNTDIVIISVMMTDSLKEVSVYSVYALAISMIIRLEKILIEGIQSFFGRAVIRAKDIGSCFDFFESVFFPFIFIMYTCYIILASGFAECFASGVMDTDYVRPGLGVLFGVSGLLASMKDHYVVLINAYGSFRKTKYPFVFESVINLVLTICLIPVWGINGAIIATIIAHAAAFIGITNNIDKNIINGVRYRTMMRLVLYTVVMLSILTFKRNALIACTSWTIWIKQAIKISVVSTFIFFAIGFAVDGRAWIKGIREIGND